MQMPAPPVEGKERTMAGTGRGDVFIIQYGGKPGAFPLKRIFQAKGPGIVDIIAVLFWLGDTQTATVLHVKKELGFPGSERL